MIKVTRKHNFILAGLLGMTALAPIAARAQMIPGYNPPQTQSSAPQPVSQSGHRNKEKEQPEKLPNTQAPVLPERPGGLIKNPMPSSVAPKLTSPPPSNRIMSVSSKHIDKQVSDLISNSDERIKGISLGNEKFPDQKTPMTELEREMSYDQRLREMAYLQKLSEQGIKLFNTTYDGKREWDYGDGLSVTDPHNIKGQPQKSYSYSSSSYSGGSGVSASDDDDELKIAKEKAALEQKRLEAEKIKMEEARQAHEEAQQRRQHDLEIAKKRMAEASPDPKVAMIYGVGRSTRADILIPYVGRVVGLKVGSVINSDNKLKITSINSDTVTTKDESGTVHTLEMGDIVDKVRPSLSKFLQKEDDE